MPVNFIPNQPFIFELPIGAYPCLNNDPRAYAQLVQPGDKLCVQWQMEPCIADVECEPEMYLLVEPEIRGTWTTGNGWSSTGYDNGIYAGNGGVPGTLNQVITPLTQGAIYRFRFTIAVITGVADITIALGVVSTSQTFTEPGTYDVYLISPGTNETLEIIVNSSATAVTDIVQLNNMLLNQVTECWQDTLSFGSPSWTYKYNGAYGKFCALDVTGGDLINTTGYTTAGNYHSVSFVIDSCTQGGLEVVIGTVSIGTTSGNGSFTFYGIPTSGSGELRFIKQDNFDGCISQVDVNDFGNTATRFNVRWEDLAGNDVTATYVPDYYDDRLVWCTDWTTLDPNVDACEVIKMVLQESCDDEVYVEYTSINYANYNPAGWDCTKVVEAYSDGYAYGFYFGDINSPDFTLVQRLRVLQFNPIYPNEGEEYLYSNGAYTRSFGQTGKRRQCWFDYVDEACHDTIRVQLMSQKLFVDNYAFYFPIENYEPEWAENGKYNLAQSRVILVHEETLFSSPCGALANPICPPSIVAQPYSEIFLRLIVDLTGLDVTAVTFSRFEYDTSGNIIVSSGSLPYNLTLLADRALFLSTLLGTLDSIYGATFSGTLTYSSNTLTININRIGTFSIPQNATGFDIDVDGFHISVPVGFNL